MSHFKNISIDLLENGSYQVSVTKAFDPEHGGGEQTFKENGGVNPHFALDIAKQMITVSPSTRQPEANHKPDLSYDETGHIAKYRMVNPPSRFPSLSRGFHLLNLFA